MKKSIYLFLSAIIAIVLSVNKANAQTTPTITGHYIYDSCYRVGFVVYTDSLAGSGDVETSYGDGSKDTTYGFGYYYFGHTYTSTGTYTVTHVLISGGSRVDSISYSYTYSGCGYIYGRLYHDVNSNCSFDAGDKYIYSSTSIEVDSAGIPVDTISAWASFYYKVHTAGVSFSFKVLSNANGFLVSCPSTGTLTAASAIGSLVNAGDLGFDCPSGSGFDVAIHSYTIHPGRHSYATLVTVTNTSCTAKSGTLTVTVDSKYHISSEWPSGTVSGNTVTWSYSGLTADSIMYFEVYGDVMGAWLTPGDTVVTKVNNPWLTGDGDTTNNSYTSVDTVTSSWDPNDKAVMPKGAIAAGTRLTYTLSFENTGNAPAENIHILDTLSSNLDVKSMQVVTSSHKVNVSVIKAGSLNILKFDFPGIHLLDSSHHGQCDGFVMFSINSNAGLTPGAKIDNQAGIYFDENEVVMTNMVENAIVPTAVPVLNSISNIAMYPNPVKDVLTIKTDKAYDKLTIINSVGQTVMQQTLYNKETRVNVKALTPGMYYIMLRNADGVKVEKIEKL
ncbi:MAG: DUF7619 domain-containing protein [Flavipsychrobacter sp.]